MSEQPRKTGRLYCANPACGQPLDWAAVSHPKADTPASRIHRVLWRSYQTKHFMCYSCGHYTIVDPVKITIQKHSSYVELVAETPAVNSDFLHCVLDEIEDAQIRHRGEYLRLLIEIIAPRIEVSPTEALDVFQRGIGMGLRGSQVAYVITGRPWSVTATVMEKLARTRGIHLGFFVDRASALSWLNASDEAGRTA